MVNEHHWTDWIWQEQFVTYTDGTYYEVWEERWCEDCGNHERRNYTRVKMKEENVRS